ncbi:1-(5-phosphoribosyl)-5-[(5-phosphoribosylamino)methylideneamino]imidazole-4-carboxamide isomerase [Leuconostocaceae bacterium ESL0723]|nr:1-(5-phosphoribosyl)-5-[(5-phosphoribosylamino)methylideneamino]imidazole-4-carboxamide isomerase [Leuconostocaceae bacterium ESL0723]
MIFPAIDLLDGQSVRLYQGDYQQATLVNHSPVEQAQLIESAGLGHLHLVDLDGSKAGQPVNLPVIEEIRAATDLKIELGGGIRNLDQVQQYLASGIDRVIIGSAAVKDPEFLQAALDQYGPDKIVVGVDGRDGQVMVAGWQEGSGQSFDQVLDKVTQQGARQVVVTDVSQDGTLAGPNIKLLADLQDRFPQVNIIASGGISSIQDIKNLQAAGIQDVIVGRALYSGDVTLAQLREVDG